MINGDVGAKSWIHVERDEMKPGKSGLDGDAISMVLQLILFVLSTRSLTN